MHSRLVTPAWLRQIARQSCFLSQAGSADQMLSQKAACCWEQCQAHYCLSCVLNVAHAGQSVSAFNFGHCYVLRLGSEYQWDPPLLEVLQTMSFSCRSISTVWYLALLRWIAYLCCLGYKAITFSALEIWSLRKGQWEVYNVQIFYRNGGD